MTKNDRKTLTKKLGQIGERLAAGHLKKNKYKILERNFRSKFGEIDIVAEEGGFLVFVEVKTRWSKKFGLPEESITFWKIQRIIRAGQYFKLLNPKTPDALRLDAVAVDLWPSGVLKEIRLIKNISG